MVILLSTNANSFDLSSLKTVAAQACDLDLSTITKGPSEALIVLSRLLNSDVKEDKAIIQSERVQKHYFFSFLIGVKSSFSFDLLSMFDEVRITVISCDRDADIIIASGELDEWVNLITRYSIVSTDEVILFILNRIQNIIEKHGLAAVFRDYIKLRIKNVYYLGYSP